VTIEQSYQNQITDEFIDPIVMVDAVDQPVATIQEDDVVISFNFRTDRGRELTEVLSQHDFHEQNMHKLNLYYVSMQTDDLGKSCSTTKTTLQNTGEVLEKTIKHKLELQKQRSILMLPFFSGGREITF
jgi:2,3-bisphosphoglycerate-independent phosphoglycerate mutase